MNTIAALYVQRGGAYWDIEGVDPWDEERDARLYAGPYPVVAHPPCERWGRYWGGGPMLHGTAAQKTLGDDGGCFAAAISAVRKWGGILEHPEASHAWRRHNVIPPLRYGGWSWAGDGIGWSCCVEQGMYGHRSRKPTWLYAAHVALPPLRWGRAPKGVRMDEGFHSKEERRKAIKVGVRARLPKWERAATPVEFRDLLISIARSAYDKRQAA